MQQDTLQPAANPAVNHEAPPQPPPVFEPAPGNRSKKRKAAEKQAAAAEEFVTLGEEVIQKKPLLHALRLLSSHENREGPAGPALAQALRRLSRLTYPNTCRTLCRWTTGLSGL
jgi:hypothetical protein